MLVARFLSWRIGYKLALLIGLVSAFALGIGAFGLLQLHREAVDDRIATLREVGEIVKTLAANLAEQARAGKMTREQALTRLTETVQPMRFSGGENSISIYTKAGVTLANPNPQLIGQNRIDVVTAGIKILRVYLAAVDDHGFAVLSYLFPRPGQTELIEKIGYGVTEPNFDLLIITGSYADDIDAAFRPKAIKMAGIVLACVVLMAGIAWLIGRGISRPLADLRGVMARIADGDLDTPIETSDRDDEVGDMARAVQVFKANGLQAIAAQADAAATRAAAEGVRSQFEADRAREAAEDQAAISALGQGLKALATGNLTHQVTAAVALKTQPLKDDFNAAAARLRDTMSTITAAIEGMTTGTGEISQAADDLSRRTEQQAASLEETAAALDEITATVRKTAEGANHVQTVVSTAKQDAEHSSAVVAQAVAAMSAIEGSAQQISQIIGVIDEIAFQTNLLALNAGVEAARAGEAGRGFAVVASEVRALAQRSAEAAKEIKALISTSSQQVDRGVKLVGETGESLQRIAGHVAEVYTAISDIAASAKEQASGLHEVNTAINQMDQVTQQNAAMVEQSTAASHSLSQETAELSRLTNFFQTGRPSDQRAAAASRAPIRAPARSPRPAAIKAAAPVTGRPKPVPAAATADNWEEF
jgi:methyl-accepting chemotaxis protein